MINQNTQKPSASMAEQPPHLVSWQSVAAGLLVSFFTMAALIGLGMALGGIGIGESISLKSASVFTGLWFLFSTILSIFVGSYYSSRLSFYRVPMIGAANGLLVASLFILFFLFQTFSTIGSIGQGAGALVGETASGVGEMASENSGAVSTVASFVEEQFLDLELRSEPQVIASGVATRLLNGNTEGAQNYLAYQANIEAGDAQSRIAEFSAEAESLVNEARLAAASALKSTGWSVFFLIFFSGIAAAVGGFLGAGNISESSRRERVSHLRTRQA